MSDMPFPEMHLTNDEARSGSAQEHADLTRTLIALARSMTPALAAFGRIAETAAVRTTDDGADLNSDAALVRAALAELADLRARPTLTAEDAKALLGETTDADPTVFRPIYATLRAIAYGASS